MAQKEGGQMATIDTPYDTDEDREHDLINGEPYLARPRAVYQTCLGVDQKHDGGFTLRQPLASSAVDLLVWADRMAIRESMLGRSAPPDERTAELRVLLSRGVPLTFYTKPAE